MTKKTAIFISCSILIIIIGFIVPFSWTVKKELSADIYHQGVVIDNTTIKINGKISKRLLSPSQSFIGTFSIESYEPSIRPGSQVKIDWDKKQMRQDILYFYAGDFKSFGTTALSISKNMDNIAIALDGKTIISTSKEAYLEMVEGGL